MWPDYFNVYPTPRYVCMVQTQGGSSPGDGLAGLPSSPVWY